MPSRKWCAAATPAAATLPLPLPLPLPLVADGEQLGCTPASLITQIAAMNAAPPEGSRTLCELQCRLGKFGCSSSVLGRPAGRCETDDLYPPTHLQCRRRLGAPPW